MTHRFESIGECDDLFEATWVVKCIYICNLKFLTILVIQLNSVTLQRVEPLAFL